MTTLELDDDKCPIDDDFADCIVCGACVYCEQLTDTTVECSYGEDD